MPGLKTDNGLDWSVDRIINGDAAPEIQYISIGTGTTNPTNSDTTLENEVYQASVADTNANLYTVNSLPGTYRINVTVSGGVEIPAGTDVSEFGIFDSNNDMLYREVRSATTVASGERISFEIEIELINA